MNDDVKDLIRRARPLLEENRGMYPSEMVLNAMIATLEAQAAKIEELKLKLADEKAGAETLDTEAMDANDKLAKLAGIVLQCEMGTPQGRRARDYARYCLKLIDYDSEAEK